MFRRLIVAAIVLLTPLSATAQTWVFEFAADEIGLSSDGYRAAREIGDRVRAQPGLWQADVELEPPDGEPPDGGDVWRLRAVMLELAEQGVLLPRTQAGALVFEEATPAFAPVPSPARIVVRAQRLEDNPRQLFHRYDPVVHFDTGSAQVSPEGRFRLAYGVVGPGIETAIARVSAHADTAGDAAANLRLSVARADSVAQELMRLGMPVERIETRARGEAELAAASADGVAEARNRRATVTLVWPGPASH